MIFDRLFRGVLRMPFGRDSGGAAVADEKSSDVSSLILTDSGISVAEVSGSDSGVGIEKYVGNLENSLLDRAVDKLDGANGDLAGRVYDFMRANIFGASNLDYSSISSTVDYLDTLSKGASGENLRAIETARTVVRHLEDYVSNGRDSVEYFRENLFGVNGVLTSKRLKDMKKATSFVKKNTNRLDQKREYGMNIGKDEIDRLDASYTIQDGQVCVNVNHNKSEGMSTSEGRVYWNSFDQMFGEDFNTRSYVTEGVKQTIVADSRIGRAGIQSKRDWKLDSLRNYAKYLR